jgi:hypothetical protein
MEDADDPDPGGWPVHPAVAFYGLWPWFAAAEDAEEPLEAAGVPE